MRVSKIDKCESCGVWTQLFYTHYKKREIAVCEKCDVVIKKQRFKSAMFKIKRAVIKLKESFTR